MQNFEFKKKRKAAIFFFFQHLLLKTVSMFIFVKINVTSIKNSSKVYFSAKSLLRVAQCNCVRNAFF